jgi:hypothetical protein
VQLSAEISAMAHTSGVDVSNGVVTKPVHIIPALDRPVHVAQLRSSLDLSFTAPPQDTLSALWRDQTVTVPLIDGAEGFVEGVMVRAAQCMVLCSAIACDRRRGGLCGRCHGVRSTVHNVLSCHCM